MASKLNDIIFLLFLGLGLGFQFYTTWGKVEIGLYVGGGEADLNAILFK